MALTPAATTATEGDVETQIVLPLLTKPELLAVDLECVRSKEFLTAFDIGKGTKARKGYIPDYAIYILAMPVVAVEVKAPSVNAAVAWEEALLYAHALNSRFRSSINPCNFVLATNGIQLLAGKWDDHQPVVDCLVSDLEVGSDSLARLQKLMGFDQLSRYAGVASASLKLLNFKRPFNQGDGPALLISKLESNTFAADLSPILRRCFTSRDQNRDPEIYKKAYVSSNEVTSYDKNLESLLLDRLSRSRTRVEIKTTKRRAEEVSKVLTDLVSSKSPTGELQLITGGVGTGKSLFARRYKEFLQPQALREATHWAFLDFNFAPDDLTNANDWVFDTFVKSLIDEGAPLDPTHEEDQERLFAHDLSERASYYSRVDRVEAGRGNLERARDIEGWRQDPERVARGASRYLQGERGDVIIVVFDNVDRRGVESQLAAFQLALWFMDQMRCIIILQMRDVTFEAHKNERPLDTYKTGQVFHISPPKFIDVVKRRLELSQLELSQHAPETIRYQTPSGLNISYPKTRAGEFLQQIYLELFSKPTNMSTILEALAGRNVRKALDMFMAIITSGHMPEDLITRVAAGQISQRFPEHLVLKILMRQDYRFFSEASGFVSNIFYCGREWERPSNLLIPEALFYRISQRRVNGENGQLGFVAVSRLQSHLERFGFVDRDVMKACHYLVAKELVEADSATASTLSSTDSIKATASGWVHMRLLAARSEYVWGVLPTTSLNDRALDARIFDLMQTEAKYGHLYASQANNVLDHFHRYLQAQFNSLKSHPGYSAVGHSGSPYIIQKVSEAIRLERSQSAQPAQPDLLDI